MFVDYFDDKLLLEGLAKLPRLIIGFAAGGGYEAFHYPSDGKISRLTGYFKVFC